MKRYIYPLVIYLIALAIVLGYAFTNDYTASSDSRLEYDTYLIITETGRWEPIPDNLLSSCLFTTLFPALIQRVLGADPLLIYKLYNCLLIAFLPVVVYLLARQFLTPNYAIMASAFMMAQPHFLWAPSFARVNIALIFFVLAVLVMLHDRLRGRYKVLAVIGCMVGIVISHYGAAYVSAFILIISLIGMGVWSSIKKRLVGVTLIGVTLLALLASMGVWYWVITIAPAKYGEAFVEKAMREVTSQEVTHPVASPQGVTPDSSNPSFFSLESRESVVQVAFGKTLPLMNGAQRVEFAFSWLSIIILSLGLLWVARRQYKDKEMNPIFLILSLTCYLMILLTIVVPHISNYYGIARVYYHALSLLGICFVMGGIKVSQWLKLKPYVVPLFILIPLSLCTTGIMHLMFGVVR